MDRIGEPFVLLIGNTNSESATSRLRVGGLTYVRKLLYSSPENWLKIASLLADPDLKYVLAMMSSNDYERICDSDYETASSLLLTGLSKVPHIVLVHEAVMFGAELSEDSPPTSPEADASTDGELFDAPEEKRIENREFFGMSLTDFFGDITEGVRSVVNERLNECGINVLPYKTNVERSTLAGSFIDDNDRGLLFRIYVPSGRLYAGEADKMLQLFYDWISKTERNSVRQDGYQTRSGQVFEFFGSRRQDPGELSQQFRDFSDFLDACVDNPDDAVGSLEVRGMSKQLAIQMVSKCAREGRRLQLDLRHTREQRVLSLKHDLESEFLEAPGVTLEALDSLVQSVVPMPDEGIGRLLGRSTATGSGTRDAQPINISINQQFVQSGTAIITSNVDGSSELGDEARQLLDLVRNYGQHANDDDYEAAIYELEDEDARAADRITARQKLRRFLGRAAKELQPIALSTLQKYVETRIGV